MAKYNFELKKKIVLEHLSLGVGSKALAKKYNVKSAFEPTPKLRCSRTIFFLSSKLYFAIIKPTSNS